MLNHFFVSYILKSLANVFILEMAILWPLVIVGLVRADTPELGVYNINESTVTVSGFSAGAAFAN